MTTTQRTVTSTVDALRVARGIAWIGGNWEAVTTALSRRSDTPPLVGLLVDQGVSTTLFTRRLDSIDSAAC